MGHLWLIGMMGTGKTSVGRELARRRGDPFYDTDSRVESTAGKRIRRIFDEDGEEEFRRLERAAVAEVAQLPEGIVAAGGGVILDPGNVEQMRASGRVLLLVADTAVLERRVGGETVRPLLTGGAPYRIGEIAAERADRYMAAADLVVEAEGDLGEVVSRVEQACAGS